jgi:hypothetical protein
MGQLVQAHLVVEVRRGNLRQLGGGTVLDVASPPRGLGIPMLYCSPVTYLLATSCPGVEILETYDV